MSVPVPNVRMKVEEFLAWADKQPDGRYELVDGKIVAMTGDTVRHNQTKFATALAFNDAVRAAKLPCLVVIDGVGVKVSDRTFRIPDVMVQCGAMPDPDAVMLDTPLIVVEVVSPTSERHDTDAKLIEYFSVPSIRHYLIVFPEKRVIVHHLRDEAEIVTRIAHDGDIALTPPGMTVPVAALLGSMQG